MRISTGLKSSFVAAGLLSLCLTGCTKEKKKSDESKGSTESAETKKEAKIVDAPGVAAGDSAGSTGGALAYLPSECSVAMHVDLKGLAANPVIKSTIMPALQEGMDIAQKEEKDFAAFLTMTGLNPITDFHDFSLCLGAISPSGAPPKGFGTVTGNIKGGILEALQKTAKNMDDGKFIDLAGQKALDFEDGIFTQMKDGALSGGNHNEFMKASMTKPSAFDKDFAALGNASLRVVVPASTVKMGLGLPGSPFANFVEKIDGASSLAVDVGTTTLTVKIATVDNGAATEMVGMAKLLMSQVPKADGSGPEAILLASLAAATIEAEDKHFVMKMQLPAAQFEGFARMLAKEIRDEIN
jgi:hypothetical protein